MPASGQRLALLDRLADHVLANGLLASNLRPLARGAGISDRMRVSYFTDKEAVLTATLDHVAARLGGLLDAHRAPAALWPYMRLWLEIASRAATGDALYRAIGERIGRGFLAWGAAQLDTPDDTDAARLLATVEGAMLLKSIGLDDVVARLG